MLYPREERYRFRLDMADGTTIGGGAQSRELCIAHLHHCLMCDRKGDIKAAWYLGKSGGNRRPQRIAR